LGLGYHLSAKSFCVDVNPDHLPQIINDKDSQNSRKFKLYQMYCGQSYSCTIAVEKRAVSDNFKNKEANEVRLFTMRED
jgi:hypothetical protein